MDGAGMSEWTRVCILCAQRATFRLRRELGREPTADEVRARLRPLESGHCCASCATRIADDLAAIVQLASMAAAWVVPGSTGASGARSVPGSRPPLNVEALDPALASVPGHDAPLLVLLEEWERMTRQMRGLAPYGPASAARSAAGARTGQPTTDHTHATLTAVCGFLRASLPWATTDPGFPLEDFAAEVRECAAALRRWDVEADRETAYVVDCPHEVDTGTCGYRLRIAGDDVEQWFHCPRCRTEWSVDRLMLVWAETSDAAMWLDHEAVTRRYGVDRSTLDRWVRKGRIAKWHGLYDVRPLALAQRRGA